MPTEPPVASNTLSTNTIRTNGDSAQILSAESNDVVQSSTSLGKRRRVEEEDEQENSGDAIPERGVFKDRAHEIAVRLLLDFVQFTISHSVLWSVRELGVSRP